MNFNTSELVKLAEEILADVPDNKKEALMIELRTLANELTGCREKLRRMQKNEIIGEVLPVIFHKMKNKLTPIMGYSQILQMKIADERLRERLQKVEKNADELAIQFNLLRDYFVIEKTLKEKVNLNDILSGLTSYFSEIEKNHNLGINVELAPGIPEDNLKIGQVEILITNIVDNAVKAINEKNQDRGLIEIKTKSAQDGYTLSISDNGSGIKKEDIPQICTPFFSRFNDGAGIGLTICEQIIANHNASLIIDSEEGRSSEFIIFFNRESRERNESEEQENLPRRNK